MEINNFFNKIDEDIDMSAQALLDQRLKLKPEVFVELNEDYLKGFYSEYRETDVKKRHMRRDQKITENYDSIYIMDRNYVSFNFLAFLQKSNIKFLSRLNLGYYTKETESMKTKDEIVEIAHTKERMKRKILNLTNIFQLIHKIQLKLIHI